MLEALGIIDDVHIAVLFQAHAEFPNQPIAVDRALALSCSWELIGCELLDCEMLGRELLGWD